MTTNTDPNIRMSAIVKSLQKKNALVVHNYSHSDDYEEMNERIDKLIESRKKWSTMKKTRLKSKVFKASSVDA